MTETQLVEFRLGTRRDARWDEWRNFVAGVRKICYGDWSTLGVTPPQDVSSSGKGDDATAANDDVRFRPVQMRDAVEGRDNHMIRAIQNIVMGLTNTAPTYQVENVPKDHALFMRLFLEKTLGPRPWGCNFQETSRSVIVDACIAGVGWYMTHLRNSIPEIGRIDPLKIIWDQANGSPGDSKWVIVEDTQRASYWQATFKKAADKFEPYMEADAPVTVAFYYDVTDDTKGLYKAYLCGTGDGMECVDEGEYPFSYEYEVAGETYTFCYLPTTPMYFSWLPGMAFPDSLAFRMVPHQRTILECNSGNLKRLRTGPKRVTNLGTLAELTVSEITAGRDPDNYYIKTDSLAGVQNATYIAAGVPIDQTISMMKADSERMITGMSGEDPFTSGANNDRSYEKATQVVAVQQASGVSSSYRSEIIASTMAAAVQKYNWAASEYYDAPLEVTIGDDVLEFSAEDRAGAYLDPNARIVIRKDTLRYMPQAERIQRAQNLLAVGQNLAAMQDPAAAQWLTKAKEDFLSANGVDDIEAWLNSSDDELMGAMPGMQPDAGDPMTPQGPTQNQAPFIPGQQGLAS